MFNGRLKVTYVNQKELTVSITNPMLNDSITILLTGAFLNNDKGTVQKFNSSITVDVQGNYCYYYCLKIQVPYR